MDYQKLFIQTWDLIRNNKFLIFLGVLVGLGGWGGGSSSGLGVSGEHSGTDAQYTPGNVFNFSDSLQNLDIPFLTFLAILAGFLVLIGLWVLGTISRGGLIYGADAVSRGQITDFAQSFRAGWDKGWRLLGIGLIPVIPLILIAVISIWFYLNRTIISQPGVEIQTSNALILIPMLVLIGMLVPVLSLLRTFANRGCMLEDLGVVRSYRRGWQVLRDNLGAAVLLFLLQIIVSIGISLFLFVPGILIAVCCFLWPVLVIVQGAFVAFYSSLWTLAWNQWTNADTALLDLTR